MATRTLEQRLKFDHGLIIGMNLVKFTLGDRSVLAVVRISARGVVTYMKKPTESDMYSSWTRAKGDAAHPADGGVAVWAHKQPQIMGLFEGEPVATVPVLVA